VNAAIAEQATQTREAADGFNGVLWYFPPSGSHVEVSPRNIFTSEGYLWVMCELGDVLDFRASSI